MKLKLSIILFICFCMILCGCNQNTGNNDFRFYFCQEPNYDSAQGLVMHEVRQVYYDRLAYSEIISVYLNGPKSRNLKNPFPSGTMLIDFSTEQQTAHVVLSDHLSTLTGIDLTMACTCLSLTVKDLTGCTEIQISAENALLNNRQSITINANAIQLSDLTP